MLFHFGCICLAYSANHRRSSVQDRGLAFLQPYLIGLNFYPETLPIEWIDDDGPPSATRISVSDSSENEWTTVLSTQANANSQSNGLESLGLHRSNSRRLLQLLTALSKNEDEDGIFRILKSVAIRLDVKAVGEGTSLKSFDRIRLELPGTPIPDGGMEPVFVEAMVARFENGEMGLVPQVEPHRSVRSKLNQ